MLMSFSSFSCINVRTLAIVPKEIASKITQEAVYALKSPKISLHDENDCNLDMYSSQKME